MRLQQILVPLDMSETARAALPVARQLAFTTGATLNLLGVATGGEPGGTRELWACVDELAAAERKSGLQVCARLRIGDPATEILVFEREAQIDLIVMATHGRTGLGRVLLGSVADKVARASTVPVVLLRPGDRPIPQHLRTLLVPIDGTSSATLALDMAVPLARAAGASIVLMQASSSNNPAMQAHADAIAARLRRVGVSAQGLGVRGRPSASIISIAKESDADLIVMRTRGRGGPFRSVLGSVADEVVRGCQRPVLLVRRGAGDKRRLARGGVNQRSNVGITSSC